MPHPPPLNAEEPPVSTPAAPPTNASTGDEPTYSIDIPVDPGQAAEYLSVLCGGRQLATKWLADVLVALR